MRTTCWGKPLSCLVQFNASRDLPWWQAREGPRGGKGSRNVLRALGDLGFHSTAAHLGDARDETGWCSSRMAAIFDGSASRFRVYQLGELMDNLFNPELPINNIANSLCIKLALQDGSATLPPSMLLAHLPSRPSSTLSQKLSKIVAILGVLFWDSGSNSKNKKQYWGPGVNLKLL